MEEGIQPTEEKVYDSISSSKRASISWTNPRKRPRSCDPTAQLETTIDEDLLRHAEETSALQSSKRMRVEEWPLKDSDVAAESDNFSPPAHRKSPSPQQDANTHPSTRPSKFVEGSMNDKVSKRPPSLYTREEEAMLQYTSANMEDVDMIFDAGIESNKPSGMVRFGKAIANAFTSVNVWQGLNGVWKEREKENQARAEKDVLKTKAELKYAELKKSGYKGTQNAPARPNSQEVPATKYEETYDSRRNSFRDSGVDVDGYRSSSDRKDSDQSVRPTAESLMPPPPIATGTTRSASPFSEASSGHRSSIRFHKPSLEGLKRVSSQIHLPSIKRQGEDSQSLPSSKTNDVAGPGLRREPSRKEIAKQYKLSKKVSDLENKLEIARRELELSLQEAPPVPDLPVRVGRKRFEPGALPSLPSERLLTPQASLYDDKPNKSTPHVATLNVYNTNTSGNDRDNEKGGYNPKTQSENAEAAKQALWNIRASDVAARNAAARQSKASRADTEIDDVLESEAAKGSVSKRNRKSQEIRVSSSHDPSAEIHKHPSKVYVKTPRNSPMTSKNSVPSVPVKPAVFDPSKVDKVRIMAMRAIPDSHVPFGKAWDDLKNLRKQYPATPESELKAYMNSQSASKMVTDHTSVSHVDRPSSPFLGRPASTSPMKTRARASRRGISPPPPSLSSAKKFHRNLDAEKSPISANPTSPEADEETDSFALEMPLKAFGKASEAARASVNKPLPKIKPDEFEWDDDVF